MQHHAKPCHTMQYHAISYKTMQYHAIQCNTMQYHAIQCNTMQYHAILCMLITADGAYHCPLGSIMAIFRIKHSKVWAEMEEASDPGITCTKHSNTARVSILGMVGKDFQPLDESSVISGRSLTVCFS